MLPSLSALEFGTSRDWREGGKVLGDRLKVVLLTLEHLQGVLPRNPANITWGYVFWLGNIKQQRSLQNQFLNQTGLGKVENFECSVMLGLLFQKKFSMCQSEVLNIGST